MTAARPADTSPRDDERDLAAYWQLRAEVLLRDRLAWLRRRRAA